MRRGILVKTPGISGFFCVPGDFRFFPGNCAVFVFLGISNCIFVDLWGLYEKKKKTKDILS